MNVLFDHYFKYLFQLISLSLIIWGSFGCGSHLFHVVEKGETLYSVGWLYGYDHREVAEWNKIQPPYIVKPGQRIRVAPPAGIQISDNALANKKITTPTGVKVSAPDADNSAGDTKQVSPPVQSAQASAELRSAQKESVRNTGKGIAQKQDNTRTYRWQWPTQVVRIVQTFDASDPARKGIDLAGYAGQPVHAAAAGRVVYSGGGLSRYGKLIIVKHDENYLSAYAHNRRLLVKEGDILREGQKIAEMGDSGTNITKLHFEIRRNGKPVDPMKYLPGIAQQR